MGEAFVKASGAEEDAYEDVKEKVEKVAQAFANGELSELRKVKELHVAFLASQEACSATKAATMLEKVGEAKPAESQNVTQESCRIVDDDAEYVFVVEANNLDNASFETAAATMAEDLEDITVRRLSQLRRLLKNLVDPYVAQTTEECAVNDADCGVADTTVTTLGATLTSGAPLPAAQSWTSAVLLLAPLVTGLLASSWAA